MATSKPPQPAASRPTPPKAQAPTRKPQAKPRPIITDYASL